MRNIPTQISTTILYVTPRVARIFLPRYRLHVASRLRRARETHFFPRVDRYVHSMKVVIKLIMRGNHRDPLRSHNTHI